jgi:5,10-methylenetetrahydromethanopterin reductase
MDVGVYVDAHLGIGEQAALLERSGFDSLWVYDSPLIFGDVYMALAEAARSTERIKLGPGVTYPGARPPHATAQSLATLATAAPGRVRFGIGIGNSARWSVGMRPATLDELHEHVSVVRALLAGETANLREGDRVRPVRLLHPHGRWIDLGHPIDTYVSAFGPRGQERAGADADAVFIRWEGPEAVAAARARIRAGAEAAGRDPDAIRIATVYAVYPIETEADLATEQALAALGPLVVSRLRFLTANHRDAAEVPEPFRPGFVAYAQYRAGLDEETRHFENYDGYLVFTPEHLERFVNPESIRTVVHAARAEEVAAELRRMADAGVDEATLQIAGPPPDWCERMARDVLPALERVS